tara:strand:- start:17018 stop:17668 length:651 start_codon:yes stop_codon:yes gene_type:complete
MLFTPGPAPDIDGIDLRCCSVESLLESLTEAPALIVADPPWSYRNSENGAAGNHYGTTGTGPIIANLDHAHALAAADARLVVWATWPTLHDFLPPFLDTPWRYVTGGCWHKTGAPGIGYHWRGDTEPVLVAVKGRPPKGQHSNGYASPRQRHSEKPTDWMIVWLEQWTNPGDLVLDLYAGLAPLARACLATGRRYIGAEIDPERHAAALCLLHKSK